MNFIRDLINSQTPFCTHSHGCIINAFKIMVKNLKYGLLISAALQLFRILKSIGKNTSNWANLKSDYFTITIFMCATVLTLRLVRCILRRIRQKDDGINSLIAGGAAGWVASKTLSKQYWYFYLTFIGSRVIGAAHKYLIRQNILKEQNSWMHTYFMMAFAHSVHSYGYFFQPYILKDDMYGLYKKMSALTIKEQKWHLSSLNYGHRRTVELFGPQPQLDWIAKNRINALKATIQRRQKQSKV